MLLNEIKTLAERIHEFQELEKAAGECDRFETRADQLDQLSSKLDTSVWSVTLLKNCEIDVAVNVSAGGLLATAAEMKRLVETDRASAVSDTSGFGPRFKRPLDDVCAKTEAAAADAWRRHVDATWPRVNQEMMHVLRRVKGFAGSVSTVLDLDGKRERYRAMAPRCEEDIRQYRAAVEALQDALRSLGSDDLPDHVVRFMRRAGTGGLPLDELTTETVDWLKAHDLLGQFVVKTA